MQVKVDNVKAGDLIAVSGYKWIVKSNVYDPYGNTGNQPRHILTCDSVCTPAPTGYSENMTFGRLVGEYVDVL